MQIFIRLRRLAAALLLVPFIAGIQPVAAAERTETANVFTIVGFGSPPTGLTNVPTAVRGGMLLANDGNIYFASSSGGAGFGSIGKLAPDGTLSVLYAFASSAEGLSAFGGLIQASDGNLYGTTYLGGHDDSHVYGTLFRVTLDGTFTLLHEFNSSSKDGRYPYTGLVQAGDGNLYGTTRLGGSNGRGTIYRIATDGTGYAVIHNFTGGDGDDAQGNLIVGADGQLYGTTMLGGAKNRGVIYRISTDGVYQQLYSFPALSKFNAVGLAINDTGANPRAGLMLSADGMYYGTTYQGGEHGNGTVFRATVSGDSAAITVIHAFEGAPFDGGFPLATPVQDVDGSFYGTTEQGGTSDKGTAWKIGAGGSYEVLHSFFGGVEDGTQPYASPLFANNSLYVVSDSDDATSAGVVVKLEQDSGSGLPVDLTISSKQVELGDSYVLTWNAPDAVTCDKFGSWDESTDETDPLHTTPISGTQTLYAAIGLYTYGLSCTGADGKIHTAYVGVYVTAPPLDTVDGGVIVGGGALSWLLLALFAALLIYKFIKETRSSCP